MISKLLFSEPLKECIGFRDVLISSETLVFTGNTGKLFLWLAMCLLETAICFFLLSPKGNESLTSGLYNRTKCQIQDPMKLNDVFPLVRKKSGLYRFYS